MKFEEVLPALREGKKATRIGRNWEIYKDWKLATPDIVSLSLEDVLADDWEIVEEEDAKACPICAERRDKELKEIIESSKRINSCIRKSSNLPTKKKITLWRPISKGVELGEYRDVGANEWRRSKDRWNEDNWNGKFVAWESKEIEVDE